MIATSFLLSSSWAGVCVLQAQQSGSATAERNLKFQPQLVRKTVSVINPAARGPITTTLKGTELAPSASGQASAWLTLPAQPVDATPSKQLIRHYVPWRTDLFGCARSNPSQGTFQLILI